MHTTDGVEYQWNAAKAAANFRRHGVRCADAALSPEDPLARCIEDIDAEDEERYVCLGADPTGRLLVTVFVPTGRIVRIISSRIASRMERHAYESGT